jgi:hypothetical protein
MRMLVLVVLTGCGAAVGHEVLPAAGGGVERVPPEALPAALDAAYLDCDADRWLVVAEVAGRAASARATLIRPGGTDVLAMESLPFADGALWQRFEASIDDPARPCDRAGVDVVIEALDANGARLDCVAFGDGAQALISVPAAEGAPRGDLAGCRAR